MVQRTTHAGRVLTQPLVIPGQGLNLSAYRNALPRNECNTCILADECPAYAPHSVCAFNPLFDGFDVRNVDHLRAILQMLVEEQTRRTMQALLRERITTGGQIDPRVDQAMDHLQRRVSQLVAIQAALEGGGRSADGKDPSLPRNVRIERTLYEGPLPPSPHGSSPRAQGGGLISQLFGSKPAIEEGDSSAILDTTAHERDLERAKMTPKYPQDGDEEED